MANDRCPTCDGVVEPYAMTRNADQSETIHNQEGLQQGEWDRAMKRVGKAKDRSGQELRTIAIGVHVGRIITNAQADENQWRQYALTRPPLIVEFKRLSGTDLDQTQEVYRGHPRMGKRREDGHLKS
jgi:hypothetical protein